MPFATVSSGAPEWLVPAAAAWTVALSLLFWAYRRASYGGSVRLVAAALKAVALAALCACLVEPLWSGTRAKPGANLFLIVADNSQSMSVRDRGTATTRGQDLRTLLVADPSSWQTRLEQDFDVRRYLLDRRMQGVSDFHRLEFDGHATRLGAALAGIRERFQGRPLAGLLLLSDGNSTDPVDAATACGLPPIYPVVCGSDEPPRDISIADIGVTQSSFEDAPVTVRADVRVTGYARQQIIAQVLGESGDALAEETQQADDHAASLVFRLPVRPRTPGVSFLTLRVAARKEWKQFDRPSESPEATLANNRRLLAVDRGREQYHVLYVSGRPNWEFKFLRRALEEDRQVRLVGMIRVAKREPKFAFRSGRAGESTNPLFSGFAAGKEEDAARYDQPVLVRLNTLDEAELRGGFPKTREALYAYHAIVLDDLESEFFSADQLALLRRFVAERGGGFLMLGGQESFREGQFDRTPVAELLPVYLDRVPESKPGEGTRLALTRDGWLEPWVRLRDNETDERKRRDEMPEFYSVNRVRAIKPGATELASVADAAGRKFPALVAQRFGHGRSAALLVGDLWRWGLRQDPEQRDLEKAWRQTIRWLVADVPERIEIHGEPVTDASTDLVRLVARVRTAAFEPLDNAAVTITVTGPDGKPQRLDGESSLSAAGEYVSEYAARQVGAYRVRVDAADDQGQPLGKAETGWASDPAADEFRVLRPNRPLLEQLARETGGELVTPDRLESFVASLPNRKAPIVEQWTYPLWHRAAVFLLAVACLIGEWGLRRWGGLP